MRTWHNLAALAVLVAIAIVTWVLVLMVLAVPAFSAQAVVTKGYDACLLAEAQRGSYSSTDGGFSALALMRRCDADRLPWLNRCSVRGDTYFDCQLLSAMRAMLMVVVVEDLQEFSK
jgi:hypothetical protein